MSGCGGCSGVMIVNELYESCNLDELAMIPSVIRLVDGKRLRRLVDGKRPRVDETFSIGLPSDPLAEPLDNERLVNLLVNVFPGKNFRIGEVRGDDSEVSWRGGELELTPSTLRPNPKEPTPSDEVPSDEVSGMLEPETSLFIAKDDLNWPSPSDEVPGDNVDGMPELPETSACTDELVDVETGVIDISDCEVGTLRAEVTSPTSFCSQRAAPGPSGTAPGIEALDLPRTEDAIANYMQTGYILEDA